MVGKDENSEKSLELFLKIGLDEKTAKNTIANNKVTTNLTAVILEADVGNGCDKAVGNLLYSVATKFPVNALVHRPTLLKYIVSLKIKTPAQLEAALLFLANVGPEDLQFKEFEESCGVGMRSGRGMIHALIGHMSNAWETLPYRNAVWSTTSLGGPQLHHVVSTQSSGIGASP